MCFVLNWSFPLADLYSNDLEAMEFQNSSKLPSNGARGFQAAESEDDFASFQPSRKRTKFSDDSGTAGAFFQAAGLEHDSSQFEDDQNAFNTHFEHVPIGFAAASSSSRANAGFGGFVTGNQKPVKVSEATKKRVAALGLELDDDLDESGDAAPFSPPHPDVPEGFSGFKTARNKEIAVSESTKQRLASLGFEFEGGDLDEISNTNTDDDHVTSPTKGKLRQPNQGNQFASAFTSARKSAAAAEEPEPTFVGFQTGRMNPIQISEETKRKVAALGLEMDDDDDDGFGNSSGADIDQPQGAFISAGFNSGAKANMPGFGANALSMEDNDDDDPEAAFELLLAKRREEGGAPKPLQVRKKDGTAPLEMPQRPLKSAKSAATQKAATATSAAAAKVPPQMRPFKKPAQGEKKAIDEVGNDDDEEDGDDFFGALDMLAEETLAFQPVSVRFTKMASPVPIVSYLFLRFRNLNKMLRLLLRRHQTIDLRTDWHHDKHCRSQNQSLLAR
jgi:hypothetical protein